MKLLIVGGYGVVGGQIARLFSGRHPDIGLLIGGRSLDTAREAARTVPGAQPCRIDVSDPDPLAGLDPEPDVIVAAVNDGDDRLLAAAVRRGIPILDITRWSERLRETAGRMPAFRTKAAPVVFSSSWMAAVPAILAREAACGLTDVASIDIDILYAVKDKAGPNSVEYMDRLATPFPVIENGRRTTKAPFSEPKRVAFPNWGETRAYRFDTPDQMTLPLLTGARSVSARIAFDDHWANAMLLALIRSGLWRIVSGPRFDKLRRSLLYNPGAGDHHRVEICVTGRDAERRAVQRRVSIDSPLGQTHLTAAGAVIQIERILGLNGHDQAPAYPHYAEALTDGAIARRTLDELGIGVSQRTDD